MPLILIAFVFYLLTVGVTWFINRKLGLIMFIVFLIIYVMTLHHHMTSNLPISL
jgi:hypothetical protein